MGDVDFTNGVGYYRFVVPIFKVVYYSSNPDRQSRFFNNDQIFYAFLILFSKYSFISISIYLL